MHVKRPREQAVDAEVFALVAESGLEHVRRLACGGRARAPADLARRLRARYAGGGGDALGADGAPDPSAFDWAALGRGLAAWFAPAPAFHPMLGPLDAAPRTKRVVAQRRRREPLGEAARPEEVGDLAAEERQETDRAMEAMYRALRARPAAPAGADGAASSGGAAPLLELVMNHASFAQTVENLFTLSFLVKEGRVALEEGADGRGVRVVARGRPAGGRAEPLPVQFVVALDFGEWARWRAAVCPEDCVMPHRGQVDGAAPEGGGAEGEEEGAEEEAAAEEEDAEAAGPSKRARRAR